MNDILYFIYLSVTLILPLPACISFYFCLSPFHLLFNKIHPIDFGIWFVCTLIQAEAYLYQFLITKL